MDRLKKPNQLETVDLQKLRDICQKYINFIDCDDEYYEDNDYEHYIFEVAMETVFGKDVWKFINSRRD